MKIALTIDSRANNRRGRLNLSYVIAPWLSTEVDFDTFVAVPALSGWTSTPGDTTLNIKPVLMQQNEAGWPKVTFTYAVTLPTAGANGSSSHAAVLEALRLFGANYQHVFILSLTNDWFRTESHRYDSSRSLFSRVRFRLPWQIAGRYGLEAETDAAWADVGERIGFLRQGARIRLPHQIKLRLGGRFGLGNGVSNGFYFDFRIGGDWLPSL